MIWQEHDEISKAGVAILAVTLGVGLTGCGSDSKSGQTSTSTSTSAATGTSSAAATTSAQASGTHQTLGEYLKQNNIQETPISRGTPGAPDVDLGMPDGWTAQPPGDDAQYGSIVFNTPSNPNDPPRIRAFFEKLTGNVDTDKLLEASPGEVLTLPGYEGGPGERNTLAGYPAYQVGGEWTKDGAKRMAVQKVAVIQAGDSTYLLLVAGDAPAADGAALNDATNVIDEKTTNKLP
jgi:hypothetical protein